MRFVITKYLIVLLAATIMSTGNPIFTYGDTLLRQAPNQAINPALKAKLPRDLKPPKTPSDAELREILFPIYFTVYKSDLTPEAKSYLQRLAAFLETYPTVRLLAAGHADEPGSADYNMILGDARARSVQAFLSINRIAADRVVTTSFGKERPAIVNCGTDESCRSKNRRVEWQVLGK